MKFIFHNWPDQTEREFRKIIKRFVDDGKTYSEIVNMVQETFVKIIILKIEIEFKNKREFFKKYNINRTTFNYWLKKYREKYED